MVLFYSLKVEGYHYLKICDQATLKNQISTGQLLAERSGQKHSIVQLEILHSRSNC